MLKIVIPDPGLREYGGHHPAMINSIANTQAVIKGDIHLEVYCNQACSNDFIVASQSKQVTIKKHFNTDFYQYFYQSPKLITLNSYIKQLSKEYLCVFEQYSASEENGKIRTLFLYHTLNGEHAIALASAIFIYNKHNIKPLQHCVFLMFSPIKHNEYDQFNVRYFLNFKLGFSLLIKQKNVQYYAGEEELQQHYQYLLNSNPLKKAKQKIAIHPCGLLSQNNRKLKKSKTLILFTGDAKVNKGFLSLPSLVEQIIQNIPEQGIEFIIQYTITNDGKALKQVDEQLQSLAKLDSRINLTTRFWSHTELHENFSKASSIVFNYDSEIYKNQSSGVLWLAASHNLHMVFLTTNWLSREAKKLGCEYSECSKENLSQKICKTFVHKTDKLGKISKNNYRKQLFQDIGEWLLVRRN